jgi:cytoplasmic iron level regulating protein YaaA (DUF328/UPF0246 family)
MIILLSPAKSLDFNPVPENGESTPRLLQDTDQLIKILNKKSSKKLQNLMSISGKLANENEQRYKSFDLHHSPDKSKVAVFAFRGDVYRGLESESFNEEDLSFAQTHVRILSGLYGLLRPMDLIQPYRLEMGTKLKNRRGKNLYKFWGDRITNLVNDDLKSSDSNAILNLASKEYFASINTSKLNSKLVNINFKEYNGGDVLKFISFNAKRARGLVTKYVVKNRMTSLEDVMGFNLEDYSFSAEHSTESEWLFIR